MGFSDDLTTELSNAKCTVSACSISACATQLLRSGPVKGIPSGGAFWVTCGSGERGGAGGFSLGFSIRPPGMRVKALGFFRQAETETIKARPRVAKVKNLVRFILSSLDRAIEPNWVVIGRCCPKSGLYPLLVW